MAEKLTTSEMRRLVERAGRGPLTSLTADDYWAVKAEEDAAQRLFPDEWREARLDNDGARRRRKLRALRERAVRHARSTLQENPHGE